MATVETEARVAPGERRVVIRDVGWQGYQTLLNLVGDQPVRITYDRGDVELMSPLLKHERNRFLLARMVQILTEELEIPMMSAGSTTLNREDLDRGLEADDSFYFWDLSRIRDPDNLDLEAGPASRSGHRNRDHTVRCWTGWEFTEPWEFRRSGDLTGQDCGFSFAGLMVPMRRASSSKALPWITIDEIERFAVKEDHLDESLWALTFRQWVQETVVPRFQAEQGASEQIQIPE